MTTATKVEWWKDARKGIRGHSLMTQKAGERIPPLYGTQDTSPYDKVMVWVRLFSIANDWTWYITEWDPKTGQCFGLVNGFEAELGYFDLNELSEVNWIANTPAIERDLHWPARSLGRVRAQIAKGVR